MVATLSDSELGRVLLTLRGIQWIIGTKGDPYALLLRMADDDPHELGREVRDRGALYWSSAEAWVTARHDIGATALADPRLSPRPVQGRSAGEPAGEPMPWDVPPLREVLPLDDVLSRLDRWDYASLAHSAGPSMDPEPRVAWFTGVVRRLLDGLGDEFDLVTDLARPAAVEFAAGLLAIPAGRRTRFAELCAASAGALDATACPPQLRSARRLTAAVAEFRRLFAETTSNPSVSLLHAVVGVDVATTLVCNAVGALLDHPDQCGPLHADPDLAGAVVEETLRYAPPVRLQRLFARQDLELGGQAVQAGEEVVVLIEAANRDPRAYRDPDRFDIRREGPAEHLTPDSPELCAGLVARTARVQAEVVLRAVATGLPGLRRAGDPVRRLRSPVTAAVVRMAVTTRS